MQDERQVRTGGGAVRDRRRTGAAAAGGGRERRRRPLGLLLGALAALGALAIVLALTLSGSDKHRASTSGRASTSANHSASGQSASAGGQSTGAAATGAGSSAGGQSTGAAATGAGSSGSGATALIGGGSVPPRPATGRLAQPGSVGAVLFPEAGTGLDAPANAVIAHAVEQIRRRHLTSVRVVGYTDRLGNPVANRALSLRRARTVVAALRRQVRTPSVSYVALAEGEQKPVAPNSTAQGRQLNRRVVIFVRG